MNRNALLIVLTIAGSALCWWPAIIEPSIGLSPWLPLALIALMTGLSTTLSNGNWPAFPIAATVGTFAGLCSGVVLFPSSDGIANAYAPIAVVGGTLAALLVSLIAGMAATKILASKENHQRVLWVALVCCVAFGPVALALTPPLVAHRLARNDRLAGERFDSLRNAVEQTVAEAGDPRRSCDGQALRRHYSGPPFSEKGWQLITEHYVKQDGYYFIVGCRGQGRYSIHGIPWGGKADGTSQFCADQSGKVGCSWELRSDRWLCVDATPCRLPPPVWPDREIRVTKK
jgi:hypothetical protein